MNLFHLSQDQNIHRFVPRPIQNRQAWPHLPPKAVWAVSSEMAHNYYLPRQCPRVCRMPGPKTTRIEMQEFSQFGDYRAVIFVPEHWMAAIKQTVLYRYTFNPLYFYPVDFNAGYYISTRIEEPTAVQTIQDLPRALHEAQVLLKYVPDLTAYAQENLQSNFRFSNIRMKNLHSPPIIN